MRRAAIVLSVLGLVACSKLFGTPSQCKTDADCADFAGAVCDTSQNVCVTPPAPPDVDASVPSDDAAAPPPPDTGPPPPDSQGDPCSLAVKPQATVGGADAGVGPDGGVVVDITADTTLSCDKDWLLKGTVTVHAGATLTVQKGTRVMGDTGASLQIVQGAKIVARGEKDAPVVFTSSKPAGTRAPGDWVGLVIAGNAGPAGTLPTAAAPLAYGGGDAADSSGALNYVRVEYTDVGMVFGGLGTGTLLDFVQVRRPNDNCYAWYGGTVNAKHLVCQSPADEHFEFDAAYQGKLQFLLGQNTPPDTAGHNGILVDASYPTIYNATICGTAGPNQGYGMLLRATPQGHFANTILTGWNAGVDVVTAPGTPLELVSSTFFANHTVNVAYVEDPAVTDPNSPTFDDDNGFDEIAWFATADSKNTETDPSINPACFDPQKPAFGPPVAITATAATPPGDGFFDANAAYVGALKDQNDTWATGAWIVWSAQ